MAIFAGTWKDGAGVPFSANAFQQQAYDGGGTAQSTSGAAWGTPWQQRAVMNFTTVALQWYGSIYEHERQAWRDVAGVYGDSERREVFKHWQSGYRLWLSRQIPTQIPGVAQYVEEYYEGYPPFNILDPHEMLGGVLVRMRNHDETVEARSHLEVFEIDPEHVDDPVPCEHSHLIGTVAGWMNGEELTAWWVPWYFGPPVGEYRMVFIRAWHVHYFVQRTVFVVWYPE